MLRDHEHNPKIKGCDIIIDVYNEAGEHVRTIVDTKVDAFAGSMELPDGDKAYNVTMVPIRLTGVEAVWSEGEGSTIFIWDCKNDSGERVGPGRYRIEARQSDRHGHIGNITRNIEILSKASRAM
jgi:outer membrane scaffolding protein for murein synthesis (MipA/OmpV family)